MIHILLVLLTLAPRPAAYVGAALTGRPDLGPRLVRICHRESRCKPVRVHDGDAGNGPKVYRRAHRAGLLCSTHRRGRARRWSTRGAWGTMAGYTLRYLPAPLRCLPPEVLDMPIIGAVAAALRLAAAEERRAHPALIAWSGAR